MLPNRFRILVVVGTFFLMWMGIRSGRAQARPLPALNVDEFRLLIDGKHDPFPDAESVAEYRRKLRKTAQDLPSLAEVSRVLLLSEWTVPSYGPDTPRGLEGIREAVRKMDEEAFKKDMRKLFAKVPDDPRGVTRAIVAEIKREVRLQLLGRMEERTRFYLRGDRTADRIAANNLITDTMETSRRQDVSQYISAEGKAAVAGVMNNPFGDVNPTSHSLRTRLRELTGDVRRLTGDADPQVQASAIRALSNLETNGAALVATLKPLLLSRESNVVTRRAAAEALEHALEMSTMQMEKDRVEPYLKAIEQLLPTAVLGLADEDAQVRQASLTACQRSASILDDLAGNPQAVEWRSLFRPTMRIVGRIMPDINRVARDRVPSLRILACRVLETLVLAEQKIQNLDERPLPPPLPEIEPDKKDQDTRNKGVSLPPQKRDVDKGSKGISPPRRNSRARSALGPSRWATARPSLPLPPPVPLGTSTTPALTLERPTKLIERKPSASTVKAASYQPPQPDELPAPAAVEQGSTNTLTTMIDDLTDPDYRVRLAAVDVLESYGPRAAPAIPALVKALCDSNKFVRWAAARTLGRLEPREADAVVPGLMRLLNDREDASVRITAAYALEQYGPNAKQAVPYLARVINRGDKDYILAILHTLQGIGTDAAPALPNVAWVLRDRQQPSSVRVEAALTLGRFGALAKAQLPLLRELMINDPDEAVRNAASTAVLGVDRPLK